MEHDLCNSKTTHMMALLDEISILKSRIMPEDTGYIYTTINTLEGRVKEIRNQLQHMEEINDTKSALR